MKENYSGIRTKELLLLVRKRRLTYLLALCIVTLVFVVAGTVTIILTLNPAAFIISGAVLIADVIIFSIVKKRLSISFWGKTVEGTVADINVEIKSDFSNKVGGIGLARRQYDSYIRDVRQLLLYIRDDTGNIFCYTVNDVTPKQSEHYQIGDKVATVSGARFPLNIEPNRREWLCPWCGAYNKDDVEICNCCSIIKRYAAHNRK